MELKSSNYENNMIKQKYLGEKGLILLLIFFSAFIPLSMNLYLPALPRMAQTFNAPPSLINLTLIFFLVFYAIGALFWGSLSDKYGRKIVLLIGLITYTIASIFCATTSNIYLLIIFRSLQAIGSGAVTSAAMAAVKDVYTGPKRASILALVQSMVMVAPITAPVVGALILNFTTWRGIFWTLTAIGVLAIIGALMFEETLIHRYEGNILHSLGRLGVVMRNLKFSFLLITLSVIFIPMMAFLSASSYIFVDHFGLSEQVYSFLFSANAVFSLIAPIVYIWLSKRHRVHIIIIASYATIIISGLLISFFGNIHFALLSLLIFPATLGINIIRPPYTHVLLEQQHKDSGAASALISCGFTLLGSIGMIIISFNWANRILVLGLTYVISSLIGLIFFTVILSEPFIQRILNRVDMKDE